MRGVSCARLNGRALDWVEAQGGEGEDQAERVDRVKSQDGRWITGSTGIEGQADEPAGDQPGEDHDEDDKGPRTRHSAEECQNAKNSDRREAAGVLSANFVDAAGIGDGEAEALREVGGANGCDRGR